MLSASHAKNQDNADIGVMLNSLADQALYRAMRWRCYRDVYLYDLAGYGKNS
jgi:hypothetical protein